MKTYDKIFKIQSSPEIIEQIDTSNSKPGQTHYLTQHLVIRKDKDTIKVCAVFDAFAKVNGDPSLNDCLHKELQLTQYLIFYFDSVIMQLFSLLT